MASFFVVPAAPPTAPPSVAGARRGQVGSHDLSYFLGDVSFSSPTWMQVANRHLVANTLIGTRSTPCPTRADHEDRWPSRTGRTIALRVQLLQRTRPPRRTPRRPHRSSHEARSFSQATRAASSSGESVAHSVRGSIRGLGG